MRTPTLWTAVILAVAAFGCGTTRMTDSNRTGTEQRLISNAIDEAVGQVDFRLLAGQPVYFDPQYLESTVDKGYLVSSLRQHLLASGALLQEDRTRATYVVEVRSGGVGTDRHALLFGVPQMNVPALVPGQPSQIPEIPLAKKTDQQGVAKVAVFAYNRRTGQRLWQSGVVEAVSTAKDLWVLGAGPFQRGSIRQQTTFAGEPLPHVGFGGDDEETAEASVARPSAVPPTQTAAWNEPPLPLPSIASELGETVPGRWFARADAILPVPVPGVVQAVHREPASSAAPKK